MSTAVQLRERLGRVKEIAKEQSAKVVRTGVGAGAAFAVSYAETRWPDRNKVLGIDLSLLVGVVGAGLGAYGVADKQTNELLEAAGLGALCAYGAQRGLEMGAEAKIEADKPKT